MNEAWPDEAETYMATQQAPYPGALLELVSAVKYRDGWTFSLDVLDRGQGCAGLTLSIRVTTVDSYPPHNRINVVHYMPVPAAAYDMRSWRRWLFEQCRLVDDHEAMEMFEVDGYKPFAPMHGPGSDPYTIHDLEYTRVDRRTSFRGELT